MCDVVLAISGSLRKPSFTEKMLDLCIEGMGPNLEVHKFYPHKMDIEPCSSCYSCWNRKTPGMCIHRDDFGHILEVYKRADYLLLASPLYVFDLPSTVKNVIDRFFVILEPAQRMSSRGETEHPKRFGRHPKSVLISSCGFPEMSNFDILRQHFRKICEHMDWVWAGELLVSAAGAANIPGLFDGKMKAIRKAGAELVRGVIEEDSTAAIASPVISDEDYRRLATLSFEGGLVARARMMGIAMKAMREKNHKQSASVS